MVAFKKTISFPNEIATDICSEHIANKFEAITIANEIANARANSFANNWVTQ